MKVKKKKDKVYCVNCENQSGEIFCQPVAEDDYFAPDHMIDVSMRTQNCDNDCEFFIQKKAKK